MKRMRTTLLVLAMVILATTGCYRGRPSEKPPIHPNPNMDDQDKYKAQSRNDFFADGSSMRPMVDGTVARGWLREDAYEPVTPPFSQTALQGDALYAYYTGRLSREQTEQFATENPIPVTLPLLKRGQERYSIYCSVCHSETGDGLGIVMRRDRGRGFPIMPTNLYEQRIIDMPDGQIYDSIANGVRNMPAYNHQISVSDRWAIVAYVRALQLSQAATADQLPEADLQRARSSGER